MNARNHGWNASRTPRYAWVVVVMLGALMLINFADKVVFGLAAKQIIAEYGMSLQTYGLINSAFFLVFFVGSIVGGFAGNRVRTTWLIQIIAITWALAQFGMVVAPAIAVLILARMILGAAEGPAYPLLNHAAFKWLHDTDRSVGVAVLNIGATLGVLIAAPVLGHLIGHYGWRYAFVATGVVGLGWCVLWLFLGKERPAGGVAQTQESQVSEDDAATEHVPYWRIFSSGTFIAAAIGTFASYWWIALNLTFGALYLQDVLNLSLDHASLIIALTQLFNIAITFVGLGFLIKLLLVRGVSKTAANGSVAAAALVLSGGASMLIVLAPGLGMKIGMWVITGLAVEMFTIGSTMCSEIAPVRQRGGVLGLWVALYSLAGVIAPALAGHLTTGVGAETQGLQETWIITGLLLVFAGIVAALFIRPERDARRLRTAAAAQRIRLAEQT